MCPCFDAGSTSPAAAMPPRRRGCSAPAHPGRGPARSPRRPRCSAAAGGPGHRTAQPGGGSSAICCLTENYMALSFLSGQIRSETWKRALSQIASPWVLGWGCFCWLVGWFFVLFPGPACTISQKQKLHLLKLKHWISFISGSVVFSVIHDFAPSFYLPKGRGFCDARLSVLRLKFLVPSFVLLGPRDVLRRGTKGNPTERACVKMKNRYLQPSSIHCHILS